MVFSSRENHLGERGSGLPPRGDEAVYLGRFIARSAAAQCSSDTHSLANAATASVVGTPRITRLTSPAGAAASDRPIARHCSSKFARAHLVDQPDPLGFGRVDDATSARQQQRLAVADQRHQSFGTAPGGHDRQRDLVEPDLDVVCCHPDVGCDRELCAPRRAHDR